MLEAIEQAQKNVMSIDADSCVSINPKIVWNLYIAKNKKANKQIHFEQPLKFPKRFWHSYEIVQMYRCSGISQKCYGNTSLYLLTRRDVTGSFEVKMVFCLLDEETEFSL